MACNDVVSPCGCTNPVGGNCVFYQGANLTCLDVTKGDDYDTILQSLNSLVCDLVAPSGSSTVITGCSSITVSEIEGGYNVCLSSATETQIDNNTTNISTLSTCVDNGVLDIVSNGGTIDVTVDTPSSGCGRVINIDVITPSGLTVVDGIIYSDSAKVGATGGTGIDLVLKSSGSSISDYVSNYGLENGDEIRWRATGQIHGDSSGADQLKFDLFDTPSSIVGGGTFVGFSNDLKSSWLLEGSITILDNTPLAASLLVNAQMRRTTLENGVEGNATRDIYLINEEVTNVDLSTLSLRIKYYRQVSSGLSATNFARQLVVEIRKKL